MGSTDEELERLGVFRRLDRLGQLSRRSKVSLVALSVFLVVGVTACSLLPGSGSELGLLACSDVLDPTDARRLLAFSNSGSPSEPVREPGTYLVNADGTGLRKVSDFGGWLVGSPVGGLIALAGSVVSIDPTSYSEEGTFFGTGWPSSWAWSPDGKQLAFFDESDDRSRPALFVMNADGTGLELIREFAPHSDASEIDMDFFEPVAGNPHSPTAAGLSWSPDGKQFAYIGFAPDYSKYSFAHSQVFVMDVDGANIRRLTSTEELVLGVQWVPETQRISFWHEGTGDRRNSWHLFVMNANGTGIQDLYKTEGGQTKWSWSPDGQMIAFRDRRPGPSGSWTSHIGLMNADGSGLCTVVSESDSTTLDSGLTWVG